MFGPLNIGQSVEEARENAIRALETVSLVDKRKKTPMTFLCLRESW